MIGYAVVFGPVHAHVEGVINNFEFTDKGVRLNIDGASYWLKFRGNQSPDSIFGQGQQGKLVIVDYTATYAAPRGNAWSYAKINHVLVINGGYSNARNTQNHFDFTPDFALKMGGGFLNK